MTNASSLFAVYSRTAAGKFTKRESYASADRAEMEALAARLLQTTRRAHIVRRYDDANRDRRAERTPSTEGAE